MVRVPTVLIPIVRELSRLHRDGHTIALLQKLQDVVAELDSKNDINIISTNNSTKHLEEKLNQLEEKFLRFQKNTSSHEEVRLTNVENKIEALSHQLARLEGALMQIQSSVNTSRSRSNGASRYKSSYGYQYNSQPPQLEPLDEEKLAMRLSTNAPTVRERRETMTKKEFERWCSERDPSKRKWKYVEKDRLYHPLK